MILNSGFSIDDYDSSISVHIPEIPFAHSLIHSENVVIDTTLEKLQNILENKNINKKDYDNIIRFWHRNSGKNDLPLIKDYIITSFENGNLLFENWQNIHNYNLTILGAIIAQTYLRTKYQYIINWDFE